MDIASIVLSTSVGLVLILSGILKLFSLSELKDFILDLKMVNKNISTMISIVFPIIEILVGGSLILFNNSIIVSIVALLITLSFLIINLNALKKGESKECHCFGKAIKTKMGYGGIIQSSLLILSLLPNFFNQQVNMTTLINDLESSMFMIIIFVSFVWGASLIVFRMIVEEFFETV